jgi:excisionase family DNA binding protein
MDLEGREMTQTTQYELEDLLTPKEAAALLKVTEGTLKNWRREGSGPPSYKLGRGVRYIRPEINSWLLRQVNGKV